MLYPKSLKNFSAEEFQNPSACYRGTPFWSWNTLITKEIIDEQINLFQKMGMGGFHVHVRVGLKNQYMSDEFLELVSYCNEKAKEKGMLCWLYDEDRYASGIAGGEVTKNVGFRARWLKLTTEADTEKLNSYEEFEERQNKNEKVKGCFLRAYDIVLESGYLKKATFIEPDDKAEGTKWYLYEELAKETPWCNDQTYVDVMNPEATERFMDLTHERYASVLGGDFGKSIPAIFTDEPHLSRLYLPKNAEISKAIFLPYTDALPVYYGKIEEMDFFKAIPYIIWNRKEEDACAQRYHYYDTLVHLFGTAYCRKIGDWCEEHHLLSTGHLLGEESLGAQVSHMGEAMYCYREFQIPGIDNLCDRREFSAVKQASSVAHQYNKEGVLSELYGVTQWDFDFRGYKLAGDWQAALGVTVRVPHLAWASMNGEAKRDYPAAIGWQSPWYEDYSYIEDYFARVNYCLTRGKTVVHVGVVHPVETFWLYQGAGHQTAGKKWQLEEDFQSVTKWLLTGGIDFDYISESILSEETVEQGRNVFCCGSMQYDVVLLPSCKNLRRSTFEKLKSYCDAGGRAIILGDIPSYVDCRKDERLIELVNQCEKIRLSRQALLERMEEWRDVDFREQEGGRADNLLYQLRQEDDCRWLFVAQAYKGIESRQKDTWNRRELHKPQNLLIHIKGIWTAEKHDTLSGNICELTVNYENNWTIIPYELYGDDSLLLRLTPINKDNCKNGYGQILETGSKGGRSKNAGCIYNLPEPAGYRMSEPNVLLLDCFEYALDGEQYHDRCEILRLDNELRKKLGLPLRCEALAQPYVRIEEDVRNHILYLRTYIYSDTEFSDCYLALEDAVYCTCTLNGVSVNMDSRGYYVDKAIATVKLPKIQKGANELCLTMKYGDCTNLEWMYVLGEFGVRLQGAHASLCPKPERLFWGDYTRQGFPFYTGNMTYLVNLPDEKTEFMGKILQVPYYSGAAVKVSVNSGKEEMLALLPYKCRLSNLKEHNNLLSITCLGNRFNGFGQLHLIGDNLTWMGPDSWRTSGCSWTDTYQVKSMGILTAPQVIFD